MPTGWGTYEFNVHEDEVTVKIDTREGELALRELRLSKKIAGRFGSVEGRVSDQLIEVSASEADEQKVLQFGQESIVRPEAGLLIRLS